KEMVRALEDDCNVALTADVPKRSRVAGLGIIMLARESGRPIMAFAMATSRFVRLNNWDRTTINLPFGKGALVGIEPVVVPPDADAATMEKLRLQLEQILNEATGRAYAQVGRPEEAGHGYLPADDAARLPKALLRGGATGAGADQAAAEAGQGGSGADRRAPRHEPGHPAARTLGVESPRQRRRGAGARRPDPEVARAQYRYPFDLGHGDLGGDCGKAVSRRHYPSICALRLATLCRALSRSLAALSGAVHRIRFVAQFDPVERGAPAPDGADQRPDVAPFVPALAPGHQHDLRTSWPVRRLPRPVGGRCRALRRARQPQRHYDRQSETGCAGAARRRRQAGAADGGDARPTDHRGGVDPSWRRGYS